ncbi:hypothetical protein EIP91_006178 [Steccherinum ochraceum]|uniref:Uncharacterized protein n=1 Tax=Steccherinum ochraceum TaxID=92696 RepID=A0A4R0R648_9APHY|nr:hypothetical protein EIP91_006178 [Steccherinum ochraceum]
MAHAQAVRRLHNLVNRLRQEVMPILPYDHITSQNSQDVVLSCLPQLESVLTEAQYMSEHRRAIDWAVEDVALAPNWCFCRAIRKLIFTVSGNRRPQTHYIAAELDVIRLWYRVVALIVQIKYSLMVHVEKLCDRQFVAARNAIIVGHIESLATVAGHL